MNMVIAMVLCAGNVALLSYLLIYKGPLLTLWQRYQAQLATHFSFLFVRYSPETFAAIHMASCAVLLALAALLWSLTLLLLAPFVALAPFMVIDSKGRKKRDLISEQLAPWLTIMANSLKSSPNITDAFASSVGLVQSPLREEIDLLVKEVKLGEHLDRAMQTSAARLKSPLYSSVMTTLLVARMTGGNLPKILDESSESI